MSSINTNNGAATGLRNLSATNLNLDRTLNKISTGKKVSGPETDASIFAIAQSLNGDLKAFDAVQQSLSSGTGINAAAIAGATAISDLLGDLKSKAIAAANPSNTPEQQQILNQDFQAQLQQINTIVGNSTYNGRNLLSSGSQSVALTSTITGGQQTLSSAAAIGGVAASLSQGVGTVADATAAISSIDAAALLVGEALGTLGANQKSVEFQSSFAKTLQDAVTEGLGSLVDSNLAAEAAKLRALQVKQSLGGSTLNIANQRPQTLLNLFNS
jgi:flagellin